MRPSASEGEREPRGRALRDGLRWRRKVENDARDRFASTLELGDAHTAHGTMPDVLRLLCRREEHTREIDHVARRILEREGLVGEAAVTRERRDELAVDRLNVDRRQTRRRVAGSGVPNGHRRVGNSGGAGGLRVRFRHGACHSRRRRGHHRRSHVLDLHGGFHRGRLRSTRRLHRGQRRRNRGGRRRRRGGHGLSQRDRHSRRTGVGCDDGLDRRAPRELELDVGFAHLRERLHVETRQDHAVRARGFETR